MAFLSSGGGGGSGGSVVSGSLFTDDYSTDKLASSYSSVYLPGAAAVVGSGVLTMPGAGSIYGVNAADARSGDVRLQAKVNPGTQAGIVGLAARIFDNNNFVAGAWTGGGSLAVYMNTTAGGLVTLQTGAFVPSASTNYWLVFDAHGNNLRVEVWTAAPTLATNPSVIVETTLSGNNAARFGTGTLAKAGIIALNGNGTQTFDDLAVSAL